MCEVRRALGAHTCTATWRRDATPTGFFCACYRVLVTCELWLVAKLNAVPRWCLLRVCATMEAMQDVSLRALASTDATDTCNASVCHA